MRLRLTPRDTHLFDLLSGSAAHLVEGAKLLAELLGADGAGRVELAARMADVERRADETTHEIVRRLNTTFVTPIDRGDVYTLASRLDDCIDAMESAADLVVRYRLGEMPAGVSDLVAVLQRQAELTAAAMPRLRSMKDLADYWVEVNRLENQADGVRRTVLAELLDGSTDALHAVKVKDVVEELGAAATAFEEVATTVEQIAVKES